MQGQPQTLLMDLFNNILRGIVTINDCLGLACKHTILQRRVSRWISSASVPTPGCRLTIGCVYKRRHSKMSTAVHFSNFLHRSFLIPNLICASHMATKMLLCIFSLHSFNYLTTYQTHHGAVSIMNLVHLPPL